MATPANLRIRRSEAQLHALAGVEREIRAQDPSSRRKYLRDFTHAFRSYEEVLDSAGMKGALRESDIVLIGDYHALPASQRFAAELLEDCSRSCERTVVLGVETVFARDQHILDEWWRREIDENELRQRIRFDLDWGYEWEPFYSLLATARESAEGVYGLDCMPREDLRKIGARDRHAAHKIAEIRQKHPGAAIVVLFGESHLAPAHLPRQIQEQLPGEKLLTVLQNVDALYWRAAGERQERVEAVQVRNNVICVFNSTPLEKYENYRLHLSRWGRSEEEGPDLVPTIYNLVDSLIRFFEINRYSSHNGTQPKFLVDLLPEVYSPCSTGRLHSLLTRRGATEETLAEIRRHVEERGSIYLPQANAFYVREFQMMYAAEEISRFLHHACRGLPEHTRLLAAEAPSDRFYRLTIESAVAYFGCRVLYPARPSVQDGEQRLPNEGPEARKFQSARLLGYMMGNALYDAYLEGKIARSTLRRLLLTHIEQPGKAKETYFAMADRLNALRK
jgi:hypothetical protein